MIDSNSRPVLHILNGIWGDITDRKGIGDELYACDYKAQNEIYEQWRKIIIEGFELNEINADLLAACKEAKSILKTDPRYPGFTDCNCGHCTMCKVEAAIIKAEKN